MAAWLRVFLAPIKIQSNGVTQSRDDRVNFRNGFIVSQVLDTNGNLVLTFDTQIGNAVYEPTPDTVPLRNGSGSIKATTFVGTGFTFSSPVTITRDEPVTVLRALDPIAGWDLNNSLEPEAAIFGQEWIQEIKPPPGASLTSITVLYEPSSGHAGLPADQPLLALAIVDEAGIITPYETAAQDNAASLLEYEDQRTLTKTFASPLTIDPTQRYLALFIDEDGANAQAGTKIHRPARWTAEVTAACIG